MPTPAANSNGHRRRQIRIRVLVEEHTCALCDQPVDKTLNFIEGQHGPNCKGNCRGCIPHPMRAEIDEDIPRSRGGSPYERANCHLMHREHNRWKGTMTLAEARAKWHATQQQHASRTITTLLTW